MAETINQLLALLQLTPLDNQRFLGQSEDIGLHHVFGGQLVGQALYAAQQTVCPSRPIHSLHCFFMRQPEFTQIVYQVQNLRDGRSFSARRVEAFQQDKHLFSMTASFQNPEQGLEYQRTMPAVPAPETLRCEDEIYRTPAVLPHSQLLPALEVCPVDFHHPSKGRICPPCQQTWMRARGVTEKNPALHQCLLAYISDSHFITTALQPHGLGLLQPGVQLATLNHAVWFQRPFNLNNWLLYNVESQSTYGGRGLVRGEFYTKDGQLIACCAQEGVIRLWDST